MICLDNSPETGHVGVGVTDQTAVLPAVPAGGGAEAQLLVVAGEARPE